IAAASGHSINWCFATEFADVRPLAEVLLPEANVGQRVAAAMLAEDLAITRAHFAHRLELPVVAAQAGRTLQSGQSSVRDVLETITWLLVHPRYLNNGKNPHASNDDRELLQRLYVANDTPSDEEWIVVTRIAIRVLGF